MGKMPMPHPFDLILFGTLNSIGLSVTILFFQQEDLSRKERKVAPRAQRKHPCSSVVLSSPRLAASFAPLR
jgi:hypothetical protein